MQPLDYKPPQDPIRVLYQDADLLVVEKPAGLLSVPGKDTAHADCLISRLEAQDPKTLLLHRLDMDTSGVMVFARNKSAQRHLGLQFEKRVLEKQYEALVTGPLEADEGQIDAPLIADWPNRPLQKICYETGKPALTRWQVLSQSDHAIRIRLFPHTGRSHQLRVHLQSIGAPIIGDRFYGGHAAVRLMLHSSSLKLRHPSGGAWHNFASDVPF